MRTAPQAPCAPVESAPQPARTVLSDLVELSHQPWTTWVGHRPVLVRQSTPWDLSAVAQMHARCSARTLLDRYRRGGRPPAVMAIERALRNPLSYVAITRDGKVVATASITPDRRHASHCAEANVLVEDGWQRKGLGTELAAHLAGVAQVQGFTELIAYPATAVPSAQRLMIEIGRTRVVPEAGDLHLHTYLPEGATLGLGSVRERLAG